MKFPVPRFPAPVPGRPLLRALACLFVVTASATTASAEDIVWDFASASPAAPPANLTVSDVTQNNNNGTTALLTASSASSGYAGATGGNNAGAAARTGVYDPALSAYFEVTLTPAANFRVTLSDIAFGTRRTNTGPQAYSLRTSADSYATALTISGPGGVNPAAAAWGLVSASPALTSTTPLTIRIFGTDGSGSAGAGTANWRIDDLKLSVVVASDGAPSPTVSDVSPLTGTSGTAVTITGTNFGATPVVRFNGTLATGSTVNPEGTSISTTVPAGTPTGPGPVTVTTNGGAASGPQPFTVLAQPALTVLITPEAVLENAANPASTGTVSIPSPLGQNLIVTLGNNHPEAATVPPSVTIPANEVSANFNISVIPNPGSVADVTATITANAAGHDQGSATIKVQNADAQPTSVVVNKFLNVGSAGTGDTVELLVTGTGAAGSTVDMRRMLIKDHSGSMGTDNGGKLRFNDIAFFSAVKAGTLLVLTDSASSPDIDPADFTLRLGLLDTTYFTKEGATTFDIANPEMIMIKGQDAAAGGGTGAIHSLAAFPTGSQFTDAPPKKLAASSGGSGTGFGVTANNTTSSLNDYDGADATGGVAAASMTFGAANNTANNTFIRALRGITTADGAGLATITNGTVASPFAAKNFFPRNTPAQTVAISLASNASSSTISSVKVTVPAAFGAPVEANVSVSGAGAGTPAIAVSGQDITLTGTAITTAAAADIAIAGLNTPTPSLVTDDGRYPFTIQTAGDAGVLTNITTQPVALVSVPVSSLRDVDGAGMPADFGKTVAIEVVCTEEDFDTAVRTSAYGQDGDFGINIFMPGVELNLVRGKRYAIIGQIIQFTSLTEISPASVSDVIDLGAGVEPTPLTITIPDIMLNPEIYEGRLIKIVALNYVSGTWGTGLTVKAADGSLNEIDVRIQSGSDAFNPPAWPATITGILGQFDDALPGPGYQIMPRTNADVESLGGGTGYDGWAAAYPGIGGPAEDADSDGVSNLLEYAGGSIPNNGKSLPQTAQTLIADTLSVAWAKGAQAAADPNLNWSIEASTTMTDGSWSTVDVLNLQNGPTSISADYIIQPGVREAFLRLKVVRTP